MSGWVIHSQEFREIDRTSCSEGVKTELKFCTGFLAKWLIWGLVWSHNCTFWSSFKPQWHFFWSVSSHNGTFFWSISSHNGTFWGQVWSHNGTFGSNFKTTMALFGGSVWSQWHFLLSISNHSDTFLEVHFKPHWYFFWSSLKPQWHFWFKFQNHNGTFLRSVWSQWHFLLSISNHSGTFLEVHFKPQWHFASVQFWAVVYSLFFLCVWLVGRSLVFNAQSTISVISGRMWLWWWYW